MFFSEDLVFLQLQKTGGTHIAALLTEHLDGRMRGKHGPLDFDPGRRLVAGSVRNPWDWYVSLWAYGCADEGGVQGLLKSNRLKTAKYIAGRAGRQPELWRGALYDLISHMGRDVDFWRDVYADPYDPMRFRRWLRVVLSPEGRRLLGADYSLRSLAEFAGFYTYRFLSVFTPVEKWRKHADDIRSPEDLDPFIDAHGAVQMFIRTEFLEDDLAEVFERIGRPEITAKVLKRARVNASKRGRVLSYYDDETLSLVGQAEDVVVERIGYVPPKTEIHS